jgi:hypothetical protein
MNEGMSATRHQSQRRTVAIWLLIAAVLNIIFWAVYLLSPEFRLWVYRLVRREWGFAVETPDVGLYHFLALLVWLWAAASCVWELSRMKRRSETNEAT